MAASWSIYLDLYISISGAISISGTARRHDGSVSSGLVLWSDEGWNEM
jgi:hypothetical protein